MVRTPRRLEKANEAVTKAIREGMARSGIRNYTALAERIGVPKSTLYDHLKTPLDMPMKTLYLIAVAVQTPLTELIENVKI